MLVTLTSNFLSNTGRPIKSSSYMSSMEILPSGSTDVSRTTLKRTWEKKDKKEDSRNEEEEQNEEEREEGEEEE